jgi:TM2 domain-containing membrane protein YozV
MKNKTTALLLTLIGLIGIAGLQYFYMGKYFKGVLWLFTIGLFGLGTFIDVFTISGQVEQHNTNEELKTIRANALNSK